MFYFFRNEYLIVFAVVLLNAGCTINAAKDKITPEWVLSPEKIYPSDIFFVGVGEGKTLSVAKDRARSEISKIFEVSVSEELSDFRNLIRVDQHIQPVKQYVRRAVISVKSHSKAILNGVRIGKSWQSKEKRFFALAFLKREQVAFDLRRTLLQIDQSLALNGKRFSETKDKLSRIQILDESIASLLERQRINRFYHIASNETIKPYASLPAMILERKKRLREIKIYVSEELDSRYLPLAEGSVVFRGLSQSLNGESDYQLKVAVDVSAPSKADRWYWVKGDMTMTLLQSNKITVSSVSFPIKVAASSAKGAEVRARQQVGEKLASGIQKLLFATEKPK